MKNAHDWHVAGEVPDRDDYYDETGVAPDGPACDECDAPCMVVWTGIEWIPTHRFTGPDGVERCACSDGCYDRIIARAETLPTRDPRPRSMIVGPNRFGIGLDVGWRIQAADGEVDLWCMNTRDEKSLASLIEDARRQGYEFDAVIRLEYGKPEQRTGMVFRPKEDVNDVGAL